MNSTEKTPFTLPKKRGGKFINPHLTSIKRSLIHFILWKLGYYNDPKKPKAPPKDFAYPTPKKEFDEKKPSLTWIGHSCFLIKTDINILTDPVFSARCSPISLGPKRRVSLPITLEELPKIDYVLLSHNHYDHLDEKSALFISKKYPDCKWIVPTGVKKWFEKRKIRNVFELSWGDSSVFTGDITISSTPTQHFSGRGFLDTNKSLWSGYVVDLKKTQKKVYFAGDTGYNPYDFKVIGSVFKGFDLSLIPIGSYLPRKFMKAVHVDPQEAVKIHQEVRSKLSIGMHWKCFCLSDEPMERPPYDLFLAMKEKKLDPESFFVINPGYYINF